jgi:hypothetical protein
MVPYYPNIDDIHDDGYCHMHDANYILSMNTKSDQNESKFIENMMEKQMIQVDDDTRSFAFKMSDKAELELRGLLVGAARLVAGRDKVEAALRWVTLGWLVTLGSLPIEMVTWGASAALAVGAEFMISEINMHINA